MLDQVNALLKQHDTAFASQDIKRIMKTYVSGPQIFLMGTGPGEIYRGPEGIEGAYNQFFTKFEKETVNITYSWISAGSMGDMAWFAAEYAIKGNIQGAAKEMEFNLSGTLQKLKDKWHILAMHFSRLGVMAEPNEPQPK